jgi:hypothetical protein
MVAGIDDWAFRRNHRNRSIVCDLERRLIVALLPDREMATVEAWLSNHPEVRPYRPSIVPEQDSVPIKVIHNSSWVDVSFGAAYSVPLPMLIDTGAGLVSLPMMVAQALIDAGEAHWSGRSAHFTMADGSTQEKQILIIHRLNIGSHALTNVEASIEPNDDATPLLSFSVLSQIGKFTIDTDAGTLTFG